MVESFPSNSHSKKEKAEKAPKKVDRIVQGGVVQRKKSLGKRFAETFTGGDTQSVGSYIMFDVMIPALKDLMADMTSQGVERMLFGEVRSRGRGGGHRGSSRTSYNRMSGPLGRAGMPDEPRNRISNRSRATHDFGEVIIPSRVEADAVTEAMFDMLEQYDEVTVADFYAMVDITPAFTDEKWGWTDLRGTRIVRDRGGYIIDLPRPEPLD